MQPYIEAALSVECSRDDYDSFREFAAEYHDMITGIILEHGRGDVFSRVWDETLNALPAAKRLAFVYSEWIGEIMGDGLALTLLNADGREIRRLNELAELSRSDFLRKRIDEAFRLFTKNYTFRDDENFWAIHPEEEPNKYFDEDDMQRIEEIGDEIDNWEPDDLDKAYRKISSSE